MTLDLHVENFELNHFWSFLHRGANLFSEIFCESSVIELSELLPRARRHRGANLFLRHFYQSAVTALLFEIFWVKVLK